MLWRLGSLQDGASVPFKACGSLFCAAAHLCLPPPLQAHPDFHQADTLKARVDEQIVHQGLWGVGVGTAVLGIGLAVLLGSGSRK